MEKQLNILSLKNLNPENTELKISNGKCLIQLKLHYKDVSERKAPNKY